MGGLFSKPKVSKPKPVKVDTQTEQDKADKQRQLDDEEARRRRAGLGSNLLFSNSDTPDSTGGPPILQKKLLGE